MAKFLVIAEKPSVAQSLAKILSAYQREDGYLVGNSCIVSVPGTSRRVCATGNL